MYLSDLKSRKDAIYSQNVVFYEMLLISVESLLLKCKCLSFRKNWWHVGLCYILSCVNQLLTSHKILIWPYCIIFLELQALLISHPASVQTSLPSQNVCQSVSIPRGMLQKPFWETNKSRFHIKLKMPLTSWESSLNYEGKYYCSGMCFEYQQASSRDTLRIYAVIYMVKCIVVMNTEFTKILTYMYIKIQFCR